MKSICQQVYEDIYECLKQFEEPRVGSPRVIQENIRKDKEYIIKLYRDNMDCFTKKIYNEIKFNRLENKIVRNSIINQLDKDIHLLNKNE
jgi:hypothetical protein